MLETDDSDAVESKLPHCPSGLFNLRTGSVVVEDADEEIMELYMELATTGQMEQTEHRGGLGFIDSSLSTLPIVLELDPPVASPPRSSPPDSSPSGHRRSKHSRGKKNSTKDTSITVEVELHQDLTALKGRKGDTGSVLWRSSLYLAKHLLSHHHFPPSQPLLDPDRLKSASVLELGSGTGLLALLLSPLCRRYTASDRLDNVRLVQRNLELNRPHPLGSHTPSPRVGAWSNVQVEEIDWVDVASRRCPRSSEGEPYDLILAVDCIYNENLLQPLVDTLTYYATPGRTAVWVVVELRSADVVTAFLEKWLLKGWTVVRLPLDAMGTWEGGRPRWVGWVGWRT